ncbi:unnamed protein product [Closterium sp. NIES-65]|nr:unnamed protein product [Closterium sp. NIES-65]
MFIVFMVFILLNFLIAIIVDAFMSVKDSDIVATSIAADLAHIFNYKWNCWRGRYLPYRVILDRLVELGAKDTRIKDENPRKRRFKSIQRRVTAMLSGTRGSAADKATPFPRSDNQPAFPSAASESRVRKQHVLTVRDKRIDVISLAMILQRRHDHAAKKAPATSSSGACLVSWNAEEDQLEQLSQWLPSLTHASRPVPPVCRAWSEQEEVVRCQAGVEELRGMMADMQSDMRAMMALLDRALPASRAHTPPVSRSQTPPVPPSGSPLPGQWPLV